MINPELLKILCCPESKAPLILAGDYLISTDRNTRRRYKIIDDIPVMLIDQSETLSVEEWERCMELRIKNLIVP
jgi:uncharacterized protein YbaR (Trm112 family)